MAIPNTSENIDEQFDEQKATCHEDDQKQFTLKSFTLLLKAKESPGGDDLTRLATSASCYRGVLHLQPTS